MRVAVQITPFGRGTGGHAGDQVGAHIGGYLREVLGVDDHGCNDRQWPSCAPACARQRTRPVPPAPDSPVVLLAGCSALSEYVEGGLASFGVSMLVGGGRRVSVFVRDATVSTGSLIGAGRRTSGLAASAGFSRC